MGDTLATAINTTLFASGNDDLRPVMSGVFFHLSSEGLTFVATDAHKLVKYTRTDLSASATAEFIMPKKALQILKGIPPCSEEEISVEYNETNAQFSLIAQHRVVDSSKENTPTTKRSFQKKTPMF